MYREAIFNLFLLLGQLTWGQIAKSSLTFVIDDTGSMGDDIDQVKYGAELVFDTVLNKNSSQIENFILVTFNDPAPPILRTVTRDRELFKSKLNSIRVDGGDDCPELSLSGIKLALDESLPRSYMYVFTDATAKDVHMLEEVQNLAIKKNTQIVFLLTGECSYDTLDPQFQSYYKLAKATSGQVFHIHKQDVEEILNYIAETVSHPKTVISVTNLPAGEGHNFTVPVDVGIKDVVVSGSGSDVKISEVSGPDGTKRDFEEVVSLPGAVVAKITDTEPGNYTITGGAKSPSTFVTTAATEIEFKYGFLPIEPTSISVSASQPVADEKTHLAIELVTDIDGATLNTVEILDVDGNVVTEIPLKLINDKQKLYTTKKFLPPTSLFKIAVRGSVKDADPEKGNFRRISPTAIEPQKPTLVLPENRAPTVKIEEKIVHAKFNQQLKINCRVNGYPKPDTIWLDKDGNVLPSTEIVIERPYDYLNILEINKTTDSSVYTCKAANSYGDVTENVSVEVEKESPKINKTTHVVHVKEGEDAEINCRIIKGEPAPAIFWYFLPLNSQEYEKVEGSEVLILSNVDTTQAGTYRCAAINEFGQDTHATSLIVEYPPTVRTDRTYIRSIDGRPTSFRCYVTGEPKPHVEWFMDGVQIVSDRNHHIYRDNSLRFKGSIENRGRFTCVASNPHGSANKTILVDYVGPVNIQPPEQSTFELKVGDNLRLPCQADGYPRPSIKWLFYGEDASDTFVNMRPSDASGSLNLRSVQLDQNGLYVCVASNKESAANMTYQVKVLAPPYIEKRTEPLVSVLGDVVMKLPCKATGSPKPAITWSKDGLNVASGTEWYEIEDDGTLFIKNVDSLSGGTYVCRAQNTLGVDQGMITVIVKPYPDEKETTKIITLEEGSTERIDCDVPHTRVDSIRWYKDRRLLYVGELTLRNVQPSNSGTYTCHISTDHGSQSKSVKVIVGTKPTFVSEVNTVVSFEDGSAAFLDCMAYGDPIPETKWYHDDKPTGFTEEVYDLIMTFESRGKYTCVVSNTFGSINRTYEIASRDCLLNIEKDFPSDQPLMVDVTREWPSFDNVGGVMRIPFGEDVLFFCPSGFQYLPETQVTATCEREKTFRVGRNVYEFSQLTCREEVGVTVRKTGRKCLTEQSEEVKVGYMAGGKFVEVYEVCVDKENNSPTYAKHRIRRSLADVEPQDVSVWHNDEDTIPLNVEEIYDCESQRNHISRLLRKWFHLGDKCCFKKRQLINARDLPAGLSQRAAFTYLNVAPQWSSCSSENWDLLEKKVRELAQSSYEDYIVWTGTAGDLQLKDTFGEMTDIRLADKQYLEQAVPRYFWKLIQSPETQSSLAIIQINVPDLSQAEAFSNTVCEDICNDVPWMKGHSWKNTAYGYTFCCSLQQFEEAFGYTGHFGWGNRDIFYGTAPLSNSYY